MTEQADRKSDQSDGTSATPSGTLKTFMFRTGAVGFGLLLLFLLAEGMGRILPYYTGYVPRDGPGVFREHRYLGKCPIPGATYETGRRVIKINDKGFRAPPFQADKPDDVYRIFCLGGSTTFGHPSTILKNRQTYPAQLQRTLNNSEALSQTTVQVINAGVPGYSVRTSLVNFLLRISHLDPDLIIVYHNTNSLAHYGNRALLERPLMDQFHRSDAWIVSMFDLFLGWSYAYQEVTYRLNRVFARSTSPIKDQDWTPKPAYPRRFQKRLTQLIDSAKENNVKPVLVSQSIAVTEQTDFSNLSDAEKKMHFGGIGRFHSHIPKSKLFDMFSKYNSLIEKTAQKEGIPFIDGAHALPKTPEYHRDYCHMTRKGAKTLARHIARSLINQKIIPIRENR